MRGALLLLAAIFSASANAQPSDVPVGSRIARPGIWESMEQEQAARVRTLFINCAYQKGPERVEALLAASDPKAWDIKKLSISRRSFNRTFGLEMCLSRAAEQADTADAIMLKMQFESFRSMMAEASYVAHNPSPPAWLEAMPSPLARTPVSEGDDLRLATGKAMFADCLVAAAPKPSDALLRTPSHSVAEKAAVRALIPFLGPCVPSGQTLSFSPESVRAFVADGLWTAWHTKQEAAE